MGKTEVPEFVCRRPAAVIGDIHGSFDALKSLLARLKYRELYVIGDICDRGPDTRGVIDLLISHRARGVQGNHEAWFKEWMADGRLNSSVAHGGMGSRATFRSYGVTDPKSPGAHHSIPRSHRDWIEALEHVAGLTVEGESFWLVHAGIGPFFKKMLRPDKGIATIVPRIYRERDYYALWANTRPEECLPVDRPVIMGHQKRASPLLLPHVMAIDTGAGSMKDGRLTAVLLPERRTISVPAPCV